jgi:uncharacterized protein YodC (DUF2158 family)
MKKFNIGDIVKLKSGSPDMTIQQFLNDNTIECHWYEKKHGIQKEIFHESMLEKKPPSHNGFVFKAL